MRSRITMLAMVLAGLLGAGLQVWALNAGFEPDTRLVIPGAVSMAALRTFAIAVPALAFLGAFGLRGKKSAGGSLYAGLEGPAFLLGALAGALIVLGGVIQLAIHGGMFLSGREMGLLVFCGVDLALAGGGACMIWLCLALRQGRSVSRSPATLVPGVAGCFWLILFYHNNSRDPVVTRYCWVLLALMAAILAFYHQAAYAFDRGKPVRTQFFTLTAGAYAFAALPGAESIPQALLLGGIGLWMLLHSMLISQNCGEAGTAPEAEHPQAKEMES